MKEENKLDQAVRLLREWQDEDAQHRGVVLCTADRNASTTDFFQGTYLFLGSAVYALYKNNALIRKIVAKVMEIYETDPGKETEAEPRQVNTACYVEKNEGTLNIS